MPGWHRASRLCVAGRLVRACTLGARLLRRTERSTAPRAGERCTVRVCRRGCGMWRRTVRLLASCALARSVRGCCGARSGQPRTGSRTSHRASSMGLVEVGRMGRPYAGFCPAACTAVTAISLGPTLPSASSGLPEDSASSLSVLCLTLLRARFTERIRSPGPLVVSYTTVSPLPTSAAGGLLSVALSRGLLRVGVTHRPALWSPDVPRHSRGSDATVSPTHSQVRVYRPRARARARARPRGSEISACRRARGASVEPRRTADGESWNLGATVPGAVEPRRTTPTPHGAGRCAVWADRRVRRCARPGSQRR